MSISLRPMTAAEFDRYLATAVTDYAEDRRKAGDDPDFARARAEEDYRILLPEGLASPGQHLFAIEAAGEPVGMIWIAMPGRDGPASAYIYDFAIDPAHRRRGHAREALRAAEAVAIAMGARRMSLNVMGWNEPARALYEKAGFGIVGIGMSKRLPGA